MKKSFLAIFLAGLVLAACGGSSFSIVKEPKQDTEGFLSPDMLQIVAVGYPAWKETDPVKRRQQATAAAETMARLRAVEYLMNELQNESAEMYQTVVMKIGSRLTTERYDPVYGNELADGGRKADEYFSLLSISGYPHTNWYTSEDGRCLMVYRVVKAGLVAFGQRGFGMYP
ncbi:MAG TPA: hypothetical protein PLM00_00835 [Spirochaetota bacterium]|nr:hypothetical protein [Spirochaetota bacterium]HPN81903.1 hypothetical protein [Spirochaetota bacterium]